MTWLSLTTKVKAKEFNKFYLSHSNIDTTNANLPNNCDFPEYIDKIDVSEEEVADQLKCLDTSKATGPDGISPKLLYEAGHSIVPSLTRLINMSLKSAKVPSMWKEANVIPLYKKGDKASVNNYRPVSLLSCVSKILERIVFKHVYNLIRDNNLLSPDQSGFQTGDSTCNQLSFLYHTFCQALDQKKDVRVIFCDISKAFDRVWHEGLIHKLKTFGIHGNLLKWFKNYLSDRHQKVIIRGQSSEAGLIKAGVPQGSVLGPLLFLIYINDITQVTRSKMKLFADDTSLYVEFDNPNAAANILNVDLQSIQDWANQWLVAFSQPKTKAMTCSYKKRVNPNVKFGDTTLIDVEHHKHLGLILSNNLTWSAHITSILDGVSAMSDVLKRLKYDLDRRTLETIYFSFIRPKLEYASFIWDNCSQQNAGELETFQLGIARTVTGARKGTSHQALYRETGWPTLAERRTANKLKNFIKIMSGEAPQYLRDIIPDNIGALRPESRYADNYQQFKVRTETFNKSFFPSVIRLWNGLPAENRSLEYANQMSKHSPNELYYGGVRDINIKHAQLRMHCSKLNCHLFSLHVIDSPECSCGFDLEDNNHYLLHCPLHDIERQTMLAKIFSKIPHQHIDVCTLLYGLPESFGNSKHIFEAVHIFISQSGRL